MAQRPRAVGVVLVSTHLIALVCSIRPAAADALVTAPSVVVVRVYATPAAAATFHEARGSAAGILRNAGVGVRWVDCTSPPGAGRCGEPLAGRELVLRIVWLAESARQRNATLGDALIDLRAKAGSMATVYADRVAALARQAGVKPADVMDRAMAHEIGHLLLGTSAHADHGLMRPVWSAPELKRNRSLDWQFSPEEAMAMRRGLTTRVLQ